MIAYRSPIRVSFFGGSCDYPSFYSKYGADIVGFAINKYCYTFVNEVDPIKPQHTTLTYSAKESLDSNLDTKNNALYGIFKYLNFTQYIDLTFMSDIVSMSGLGSSSAFICSALSAIGQLRNTAWTKKELAVAANHIERHVLREPGGDISQDAIFAAFGGGPTHIMYETSGDFKVNPLKLSDDFLRELEDNSLLFYLGKERQSFSVAESHDSSSAEQFKLNIRELALAGLQEFKAENLANIGKLLIQSWENKRKISKLVSNSEIDNYIDIMRANGAFGFKVLGSGNGGTILALCPPKKQKDLAKNVGLKYTKFRIDGDGTKRLF